MIVLGGERKEKEMNANSARHLAVALSFTIAQVASFCDQEQRALHRYRR